MLLFLLFFFFCWLEGPILASETVKPLHRADGYKLLEVCVSEIIRVNIKSTLCLLNNRFISKRKKYYILFNHNPPTRGGIGVTWASTRCHRMMVIFLFLFIHTHKPVVTLKCTQTTCPCPQLCHLQIQPACRNAFRKFFLDVLKRISVSRLYRLLPNWMPYPQAVTCQYETLVTVEILLQSNESKFTRQSRRIYKHVKRTVGCEREMLTIKL